jgi:hypothetical protein
MKKIEHLYFTVTYILPTAQNFEHAVEIQADEFFWGVDLLSSGSTLC